MLTFTPAVLERDLRAAIVKLSIDGTISVSGVDLADEFAIEAFDDLTVDPSTIVAVTLNRCESVGVSLEHFIEVVDDVHSKSATFDGLVYHSQIRTVLRVEPLDVEAARKVDTLADDATLRLPQTLKVDTQNLVVGLLRPSLHFGLAVLANEFFYDKYFPPLADEVFVELRHIDGLQLDDALDIIYAYLFELASSLGLRLAPSPRVDAAETGDEERSEDLEKWGARIRPLLVGPGIGILVREFCLGIQASDPEIAILYFAKCIEYVSATVVRERQYDDLRKRLQSPAALAPSAAFLDDLMDLCEEHRVFTKDHEALRLTIDRCCDAPLLAAAAPACVSKLHSMKSRSKPPERKAALAELSACLSATRNQLAHAKANYEATGKECPKDQLHELAVCARGAAEQCIRWYASQNPGVRRA